MAGSLVLQTGRRLADHPVPLRHRLRRPAGPGPGQEPPEVPLSARAGERLHLRHRLRGAGPHWGGGDPHPVCPAGDPGLLDRHPRPGSVRRPAGGGHHHPDGGAGVPQHRRGHQPDPHHRHLPALFQLRRHGPDDPAGRDGRCAVGVETDSADETFNCICNNYFISR